MWVNNTTINIFRGISWVKETVGSPTPQIIRLQKGYQFTTSQSLPCTSHPLAFRVLKKEPSQLEATTLVSSDDSSMAVVHPKAYIGTHGTTWASNYMRLRRECPDDFEVPGTAVHKDVRALQSDQRCHKVLP